jgi:hypothetical protein
MTSKNASGIYALRDGVAGITLVGCQSDMVPPGIPEPSSDPSANATWRGATSPGCPRAS